MLGPIKPRDLDWPAVVSLERLVPRDNFYRHLDACLDLSFVRSWVAESYADCGRPSIDPIVNFAHRWYLGYHLDEPQPDRSSLVKIRQRLGLPVFRRFFEHVVDLCDGAGLI